MNTNLPRTAKGFRERRVTPPSFLTIVCAALSCAALTAGCVSPNKPVGSPVESRWESPGPAAVASRPAEPVGPSAGRPVSRPASALTAPLVGTAASPDVVAVVAGSSITRADMVAALMDSHGLSLLEQLILLAAARQRARAMGLAITEADVAAAHEDALRRMAMPVSDPNSKPLSRPAAERLLQEFLAAKNLSRGEWDQRMEQHACLRKIAEAEVAKMKVTEKMLRQEYVLEYGERVQIRHIQLSSMAAATAARTQLQAKKDFELVARQLSENPFTAAQGGLMPAFTRNDPNVPPLIRETAFSLSEGQVSPAVSEGPWYHLIRLERRFPASEVTFEEVDQDALRTRLTDRLIRQRQEDLEGELFQAAAATIDIRDPQLRRQFQAKHQPGRPRSSSK